MKREKDIVHGSERLDHGYSIARSRSPIYSVSTFVLVKTVLALFYLSFLSPGSRRYFCFTTQFYEGIYAISNTKLVPVLSFHGRVVKKIRSGAPSLPVVSRHDSSADPTNYHSAILEFLLEASAVDEMETIICNANDLINYG